MASLDASLAASLVLIQRVRDAVAFTPREWVDRDESPRTDAAASSSDVDMSLPAAASPRVAKSMFKFLNPRWMKDEKSFSILCVHDDSTVSFNGCPAHGSAIYSYSAEKGMGLWEIEFHYAANATKMKKSTFQQLPGAAVYMLWSSTPDYNAILIPME